MQLPVPDDAALAISQQLSKRISTAVRQNGWLSFAHYMDMALYEPGLGYYTAGSAKFGPSGDFVTAPEISPLFGRTLAVQVAEILAHTGGIVLEAGAGSGALACDVLAGLQALNQLPEQYCILEVSADLRERQRQRIAAQLPHLLPRVQWLDRLPDRLSGCIIANELLDAMPVHVLRWQGDDILERGVVLESSGQLGWQDRPVQDDALLEQAQGLPVDGVMTSEIGLTAQAWVRELGRRLQYGAMLLIDYGFGEREYYHPQRSEGTLMCHYRQHAHDNPFFLPGLQDITAHVDFTAMALAGRSAGLQLSGFVTQAQFLLNCGITHWLEQAASPDQPGHYLPMAAAVQKLLSPAEMGELFKVLLLTKGVDVRLSGFASGDQRRRL